MRASIDRIVSAYDAYRGKGVLPAPNQYAMLVAAIGVAREKPRHVTPQEHDVLNKALRASTKEKP